MTYYNVLNRTEQLEDVAPEPVSKIRLSSNVQKPIKESVLIVEPTSVEVSQLQDKN